MLLPVQRGALTCVWMATQLKNRRVLINVMGQYFGVPEGSSPINCVGPKFNTMFLTIFFKSLCSPFSFNRTCRYVRFPSFEEQEQ